MQIDILRHGECEGGEIFRGSTDVKLLEAGFQNMEESCVQANEKWDRIITSPLRRCHAFAKQTAETFGIPLEVDDRLREMSFGDWEGQKIARLWEEKKTELDAWVNDPAAYTPPNGEPLVEVFERVKAAFENIKQYSHSSLDLDTQLEEEKILVVTHGGVVRALLAIILNMSPSHTSRLHVPYACMSRVLVSQTDSGLYTKLIAHNFIQ